VTIETSDQTAQAIAVPEQISPQTAELQHQNKQEPAAPEPVKEPNREGYRIQVASFKQSDAAKRETQLLIKKGYSAYHNRSGDYIAVYVGGYSNIAAAKGALQMLRAEYKDCILKKL
jgi:cell division septation protein DedD